MPVQSDPADTLVFECDLDEPPQKVWRALTEPHLLDAWLSDGSARSDAESAGRIDREAGQAVANEYEIVTAEPPHRLRYRWRDKKEGGGMAGAREVHSLVTVELAPGAAGGTHLRLTHGEFRIVAAAPRGTATRVRPISSARRRTQAVSFVGQPSWRRAA
jgi:uncharacterized protein YndB with AHSA1/START domain